MITKFQQSKSDKISSLNVGNLTVREVSNPSKAQMQNWNANTIGIDENNSKLYIKGKSKIFSVTLTLI